MLTRRVGESVRIGDDIEVTVLAVEGGSVRVGIDAPRSVPIVRSELGAARRDGDGPIERRAG